MNRIAMCPARPGRLPAACWLLPAAFLLLTTAAPAPGQTAAPPAAPAAADPCAEGVRLFRARDLRAAEPLLQRCVTGQPTAEPLACLAAIASLGGHPQQAGEYAARAVALDSTSVEARYWLGRAQMEQGDKTAAQRTWDAGLRLSADHAGILEGLARLAIERGETPKAYNLLTRMVRIGKAEGWTYRMLADLARRRGMWADALQNWREAMTLDGEDAGSLRTEVDLAILAGDTVTAVKAGRQALALRPDGPAYGSLGQALFAARRYDEAAVVLRRAVEMEPAEPQHRINLANVLEVLDQPEEAEENFAQFVKLQPNDARGRFNYGIHLQNQSRPLEALTQIQEAVRLSPGMLTARVVQGQLLEQLGRFPEALTAIDTLLARDRDGGNRPQLTAWRANVADKQRDDAAASQAGLIHLLHIVTADTAAVRLIQRDLRAGLDFAALATRYSVGPTAAQGGDIGRVAPGDLVEPMRSAVGALAFDAITPPLESRGQWHFFKRVR
ncbi:MAG: tetratricopeptide repeat protein [Candidatus Krumholzibacteriia bacterium]